jgi:CDP-glucose 4,6-dehydratase
VAGASSQTVWSDAAVLFTGAQGFIGSWVAERLLDAGATVLVLDRPVAELSRFRLRGLHERCVAVAADLGDPAALRRVLEDHGVQAVFHLAARAIVSAAAGSPAETFEINVRGTWNLLEACRSATTPPERIVVASTDKAYGAHAELPYREDHALRPRYPYDVSKACADMLARSYADTFDLPVAVTRLGNVFGGGDFNFSRLVPATVRSLLAGERPVLRSGGLMQRDFLYAEDAAAAYLAIAASLDRAELRGRAWNASIGRPVAVLDVVRRLIAISGRELEPDIRGAGVPHGELDRQWLACEAIEAELGWRAEWDLEGALEETYRWYERELPRAQLAGVHG